MDNTQVLQNSSKGSSEPVNGKRSAPHDDTLQSKRGKLSKPEKKQKTIEETMKGVQTVEDDKDVSKQIRVEDAGEKRNGTHADNNDATKESAGDRSTRNGEKTAFDEVKGDESQVNKATIGEESEKSESIEINGESVFEDKSRETAMLSSILEKGIIYFFFRGRVGVEDPQGVEDVARSYIVLRPLPLGAKLGEGPLEDSGNARLLALPKKALPKSCKDRFLMFVEKVDAFVKDLKDFIAGSTYATKTVGTSHVPAATPVAEGVYAITKTGRESHLAYHITIPDIGEIQKDFGINEKGSYVVSVKNPTASGPANATLDEGAAYPESIMKKFRNLRWMPLEPELLNYERTQFLIIGEGLGNTEKAMDEQDEDKKNAKKETPTEEMEKLEDEDSKRVEHLNGDDAIFADLGLSSKNYPKMQTTW